ncbi:hypothetical protein HD806DRAFT_218830 [Xylariaceae sp. AK1471]|nr:hypothetical protein HD806DRAFT_218830 [Xylariaceae sp. AK1471]
MVPSFILLFLAQGLAAVAVTTPPTCYHASGEPAIPRPGRPRFVPCNPEAEVSNCCFETDLCMGNGLCLGLDANNAFTFQGCTRADWPEGCSRGFSWPNKLASGFSAYVWPCRYGYRTPYCLGVNASCCEDENEWVYLPKFSNIHLAGSMDYVSPNSGRNTAAGKTGDAIGGDKAFKNGTAVSSIHDNSDRIAWGVGISLPFVTILVALGQWLFPGAPLWIWKKRKGAVKLKKDDDDGRSLEEGRENSSSERSSGLEMFTTRDLDERQHMTKTSASMSGTSSPRSGRPLTASYADLKKLSEDWRNLPGAAERKKIQNRLALRAYRRNMREKVQSLKSQGP